jgi:hypothetical protein
MELIMEPIETKEEEFVGFPKTETNFLNNLWGVKYYQETHATDFYCHYRNMIMASLKKKGDVLVWQNNTVLAEDEQLSPTFEELILTVVLIIIDSRLPGHIKHEYFHLIGKNGSIMDYKTEILAEVPAFLRALSDQSPLSERDDDLHSR